jgi:thiosulfate/3-mercaptopyruvate sulfurtransferase
MPDLLFEASELHSLLNKPPLTDQSNNLIIVDIGKEGRYQNAHIPGAVLITPAQIQAGPPIPGFAPTDEQLTKIMQGIGLTDQSHVIVYDDEGGGWAGRFIWLLDEIGHQNYSYLDGGIHAWTADGFETESGESRLSSSTITVSRNHKHSVSLAQLESIIADKSAQVWDARSPKEFRGETVYAAKGGHIPGAHNYEWTQAMDTERNLRLKPLPIIEKELNKAGIFADQHTVTHCQTHHRSGLSYLLGKLLGFKSIKAYPGSWGEWGNSPDTPIE